MEREPNKNEFDAIVVGSGPAGATVAKELCKRKKRVLILERGFDVPLKEGVGMGPILDAVSVNDNLPTVRAFTTGGTTAIYFAVASCPPLEPFVSVGVDISREVEEAKQELPPTVLPDELLGAAAIRTRESAMELGYAWEKAEMLVDLSKCAAGYAYEAKWNARSYVREAVKNGASLLTGARVLKVLVDNKRAIGVEYEIQRAKKEVEVRQAFGTKIILAAGAAASPIILRDSGIKSIVNSGFYCHPGRGVFGTVYGLKAGDNFIGSGGGALVEDNIALGDANTSRAFFQALMFAHRKFIRAFFHSKTIGVGVAVREGLGGGLQEDGRYRKELKKDDLKKLAKGEEAARQIIKHAGGKHIFTSPVSGQIGGTIRIKEHIDKNLETEYANLHVCDGSVIPESFQIPPTFTLICLGKYLANHL